MISANQGTLGENERQKMEDTNVNLGEQFIEDQRNCLISPSNMNKFIYPNTERLKFIISKSLLEYDTEPDLDRPNEDLDMCYIMTNTLNKDIVPQPYPKSCGDSNLNFGIRGFVRLPWSTGNVYNNYHCYAMIEKALRTLRNHEAYNVHTVVTTIQECAPWVKDCSALVSFSESFTDAGRSELLKTMTGIANLAVKAKYLINAPLQILKRGSCQTVTLSQEQCACLLANAFFCTFRKDSPGFNTFNMAGLFSEKNELSYTKLRFILHYFSMVLRKMPTGCVSFRRAVVSPHRCPDWITENRELTSLAIASKGSIEDTFGCLQMDFANKYIGGGVMESGAVQEEIRFLICPEMLVSCLLCERMDDHEAVFIVGAQRYSSYTGYGNTLQWAPYDDYGKEPVDKFGRIKCEVVAVDALCFGRRRLTPSQYDQLMINRELNKAFAGFYSKQKMCRPVATGHWGCGVFGGDKQLKSLIQIMAATCARRDIIYYTFNDSKFEDSLNRVYQRLISRKVTVGELYRYLITYQPNSHKVSVFDYVMNHMGTNST